MTLQDLTTFIFLYKLFYRKEGFLDYLLVYLSNKDRKNVINLFFKNTKYYNMRGGNNYASKKSI